MPRLVITFHHDGSVETLLKDKVFDTRVFGGRKIERVSEILPTDDGQLFFVKWLRGPLANASVEVPTVCSSVVRANHGISCYYNGDTIFFETYEEAVDHEIACVNELRLSGYSFA